MAPLRTAAGGAAIGALMTGAVANHQRAALVARRSVGLLDPGAILDLDRDRRRSALLDQVLGEERYPRQVELRQTGRRMALDDGSVSREAQIQPAEQVIHD